MHYYAHHISDFNQAARHLTRLERSIYRDLIELYYETQSQIPLDMGFVCRKIIARSNEESTAVEQVLNEFFTKTPTGWYHSRCEEEIEAFLTSNSQKAAAGRASAAKRALKKQQAVNVCSTSVEHTCNGTPTNQEPRTNNLEPTKEEKPSRKALTPSRPDDVSESTWADWLTLRKGRKAAVTETVLKMARTESEKAHMPLETFLQIWCARGSQGLQASWLKDGEGGVPVQRKTQPALKSFAQQEREAGWLRWEEMTGRKHEELEKIRAAERGHHVIDGNVIDVTHSAPLFLED